MERLIIDDLRLKEKWYYIFGAILAAYILIVGLSGHFADLVIAKTFLANLGMSSNVITMIMIISTSVSLSRANVGIHFQNGYSKNKIFFGELINILLTYIYLIFVAFVMTIATQIIAFGGANLNGNGIHLIMVAIGANAVFTFIVLSLVIIFNSGVKTVIGSIASGIAVMYVGQLIAGIGLIFVYLHRWVKWNPFNFLMVQSQINKPINHTMTKLTMQQAIIGAIIYGIIFLVIGYWLFHRRKEAK